MAAAFSKSKGRTVARRSVPSKKTPGLGLGHIHDVLEVERTRALKLIERALRRSLVGAPSEETRSMTKPIALQVIEGHFSHEARFQSDP